MCPCRRIKTLPSSVIFMNLSVEYFQCAFVSFHDICVLSPAGQWNYFRNGSPPCPSFYALQGLTDYICNSNFPRISQRVSPVPTVFTPCKAWLLSSSSLAARAAHVGCSSERLRFRVRFRRTRGGCTVNKFPPCRSMRRRSSRRTGS